MNIAYIKIEKKHNGKIQYLTEVLPQIPTNTILYKKLTKQTEIPSYWSQMCQS